MNHIIKKIDLVYSTNNKLKQNGLFYLFES
jgi:hypothetical protein